MKKHQFMILSDMTRYLRDKFQNDKLKLRTWSYVGGYIRGLGVKSLLRMLRDHSHNLISDELSKMSTEDRCNILSIVDEEALHGIISFLTPDVKKTWMLEIKKLSGKYVSSPELSLLRLLEELFASEKEMFNTNAMGIYAYILMTFKEGEIEETYKRLDNLSSEERLRVRNCLYSFDLFQYLDDVSLQKIASEVDNMMLAEALKTSPRPLKDAFYKNISPRRKQMILDDMDLVSERDVERIMDARNMIMLIARVLSEQGEIIVSFRQLDELSTEGEKDEQ